MHTVRLYHYRCENSLKFSNFQQRQQQEQERVRLMQQAAVGQQPQKETQANAAMHYINMQQRQQQEQHRVRLISTFRLTVVPLSFLESSKEKEQKERLKLQGAVSIKRLLK